ncbi:MAG: hypothetical protein Q9160_007941 [Pyrenula sp. 1 TL-2023]
MSFYTPQDETGSFIIDAGLSYINGQQFATSGNGTASDSALLVTVSGSGISLANATVRLNSTSNEVDFETSVFSPQTQPYRVTLTATFGSQTFGAETDLYVLPARTDSGSMVKLDSLYGGLMVQESGSWTPLFPYSFYVSWSDFAQQGVDKANEFKDQGHNIIHIIASFPDPTFNYTYVNSFLDRCDEIGLWVMYDMRGTYRNNSAMATQIGWLNPHPSLLLWYTADEPDGNTDPLNATKTSYDYIKSLDPYHPISLALNCYNFYYDEYSSGADVLMPDVYPISINATYSIVYNVPCNTTYGDCGCDDCIGSFTDITTRLDRLAEYQTWLDRPPKTLWAVPQAFGGSEYWPRVPTPSEMVVMDMLNVNHNAKGLVAWIYPTDQAIQDIRSQLATVLTQPLPARFFLGAPTTPLVVSGAASIDVAGWRLGDQMLISVVYWDYASTSADVSIALPEQVEPEAVNSVLWGTAWTVSGGTITKSGLDGLEVDLLLVDTKPMEDMRTSLPRKPKALQRPL